MPVLFKTIDNTFLHEPDKLDCHQVKVGDEISITIPKALTKCKPKLAIVKCGEKTIDCLPVPDVDKTILLGCVYSQDNDEMASANIVVKNKDLVPPFTLGYSVTDEDGTDNAELFEYEGGTFDELVEYLEGNGNFGFEITNYGIKIFVDKKYAGETIYLNSDKTIFLLGKNFCLNNNREYGLSYCLPTTGCYQILLYTIKDGVEEILAYSNSIQVVDFEPPRTSIVEWYENGFYHRERLPIWIENSEIQIEETEEVLSNGKVNIKDVIIRAEAILHVNELELSEHKRILHIMKRGVKFNSRRAKLRGEYSLIQVRKKYMATGTLNFEDEDIIDTANCNEACNSGSTLRYDYA